MKLRRAGWCVLLAAIVLLATPGSEAMMGERPRKRPFLLRAHVVDFETGAHPRKRSRRRRFRAYKTHTIEFDVFQRGRPGFERPSQVKLYLPNGDLYSALDLEPFEDESIRKRGRPAATARVRVYWFSVKMTARLDVNATPGGRMSPIAPGIVPECSGASRVKRAARAGFAALDAPCALWYSMLVGERERSGAPGIRVFMRAPCSHGAHAAASEPARVCGLAPTRSGWPCHP